MLPLLSDLLCNKNIPKDYMSDERTREAYRSYYHEQSFCKALSILGETLLIPSVIRFLNEQDSIHIADLATGTGGFAQGILHGLESVSFSEIRLSLQDRSKEALTSAEQEIKSLYPGHYLKTSTYHGILPDFFPPLFGLQILTWGNMLTEWDITQKSTEMLLKAMDRALVAGGIVLIAEPADRISARKLHQFSNDLLKNLPEFEILAPCPNSRRGNCPALLDEGDWCHEDRPHQFSQELIRTSKRLGHIKDSLKMSYLVCQKKSVLKTDFPEHNLTYGETTWKMISEMTHERGLSKSTFCNGKEWITYRLLKRHKSPENNVFFRIKKGQAIKIGLSAPPEKKGDLYDIPEGTTISRLQTP